MRTDGYAPLRDYAAIGDGRTVALVALDGSIDWLCFPAHDSLTIFGALLDPNGGGRWAFTPAGPYDVERRYIPETNVLETTFKAAGGVVRVTDMMALQDGGLLPWIELVRKAEGLSGSVPMSWSVEPRFGHGKAETTLELRDGIPIATDGRDAIAISTWDAGEPTVGNGAITGDLELREGETALVTLSGVHDSPIHFQPRDAVERRLEGTVAVWKRWILDHGPYDGPWKEAVERSVLVLKLLIHTEGSPSGAG